MACLGCQKRYRAALEAARATKSGDQSQAAVQKRVAWRRGVIKKMKQTPQVQPQPKAADIVTAPDCGPKDASTGQLISTIKEGVTDPNAPTIAQMNNLSGGGNG